MKKTFFFLGAFFIAHLGYSQFLTSGTVTTDNKYRSGGLGIGYSTAPAFGTNKFMVTGNSAFTGNVGIGTTTPSANLDVMGTTRFRSLPLNDIAPRFVMSDANGNLSYKTATASLTSACTTLNYLPKIDATGNLTCSSIYENFTNGSNRIFLGDFSYLPPNTSFDAGTHVSGRLSVHGSTYSWGNIFAFTSNSSTQDNFLWFSNEYKGQLSPESESSAWRIGNTRNGSSLNTKSGFTIYEGYSSNQTRFFIEDNTGRVGIGTTNLSCATCNDYLLFVKKGIKTERVKVEIASTNNWADYVFDKDYKLPTLAEVEKQIKEKGHLKDIPSAKDVVENGIELGEMNKLLLQKVEELTLYLIEQNKEIEKLKLAIKH